MKFKLSILCCTTLLFAMANHIAAADNITPAVDATKLISHTYIATYMSANSNKVGCPTSSSPDSVLDPNSQVTVNSLSGKPEYLWQCDIKVDNIKGTPPALPDSVPDSVKEATQSHSALPDNWSIDEDGNHYTYYEFPGNRFVPTIFTGAGILCDTGNVDISCTTSTTIKPITRADSGTKQVVVSTSPGDTTLTCNVQSNSCRGTTVVKAGTITTMQCCNNNLNGGPWACQKDMHDVSRWDGNFTVCDGGSWMCPNPITQCN